MAPPDVGVWDCSAVSAWVRGWLSEVVLMRTMMSRSSKERSCRLSRGVVALRCSVRREDGKMGDETSDRHWQCLIATTTAFLFFVWKAWVYFIAARQ